MGVRASIETDIVNSLKPGAKVAPLHASALSTLMAFFLKDKSVNPAYLVGGTISYDPGMKENQGLTKGGNLTIYNAGKDQPVQVVVGPSAFGSASNLYSTVIHEYVHAEQWQPNSSTKSGQGGTGPDAVRQRDVEAYATEILNSRRTGIARTPDLVKDLWKRLYQDNYMKLPWKLRKPLTSLVGRAAEIVKSIDPQIISGD